MTSLRSVKVGTYTIFEALSQETSRMCMSVITEKKKKKNRRRRKEENNNNNNNIIVVVV